MLGAREPLAVLHLLLRFTREMTYIEDTGQGNMEPDEEEKKNEKDTNREENTMPTAPPVSTHRIIETRDTIPVPKPTPTT